MYSIYKTVHSATALEHCVYCNLLSAHEKQLVVAGTSQLHIYRLNSDHEVKDKNATEASKKSKLECVMSYNLWGNISSMQKVRITGSIRDSIILTFKHAKMSILDYDPETHSLKTTSLHYFEDEELTDGRRQVIDIPVVCVDPDNRCAVELIYGTHLVVVPFKKDIASEDTETGKLSSISSYTIDIRKQLDEKISNVIDIQFLHGYYEPTLFILYEPLPTWPGRTAVRTDTCSILALSINMQDRVHPIVWSANNLPFDCIRVHPVPKPIGGVLVFAVNSVMYMNQSTPTYAVSLNSIGDHCTAFPLKHQEGVKLALDCCQAAFISYDRLVLSLKGGEIYVLTLMVDGTRNVRSFHFDKAASSVLTTCMCHCDEGFLFLGSRLGNSLLLKYTEKEQEDMLMYHNTTDVTQQNTSDVTQQHTSDVTQQHTYEDLHTTKKKRLDTMGDWMASNVDEIDDMDELEVYGSETEGGTHLSSYTFEVCDSIMNIGPCGQITMGEPAFLSEEFSGIIDPDIELVSTSGYGKNGALSVLQRSIRPQVVTTFELPGCTDMWTVVGNLPKPDSSPVDAESLETEEKDNKDKQDIKDGHAYLILSREDSTMILQTGQEIMELDHSGFITSEPTVYASNMGNNKYIIQVSPSGVRLLEEVKQVQHIPLDLGSPIIQCSVIDPYVLVLSAEGQLVMLNLRPDSFGSGVRLALLKPDLQTETRIECMCLYKDISGLFVTSKEDNVSNIASKSSDVPSTSVGFNLEQSVDDEDELLYGDSSISLMTDGSKVDQTTSAVNETATKTKEVSPTFWACLYRENHSLEIYSVPDFKLSYVIHQFPMAYQTLQDDYKTSSSSANTSDKKSDKSIPNLEPVSEIVLVGLGNKKSRPYLLACAGEECLMYEVFPCHLTSSTGRLKIRFKKTDHNLILREKKSAKAKTRAKSEAAEKQKNNPKALVSRLRYFEDISGYSGVFLCGPYPHWLFMSTRGSPRFHPMGIDGKITSFTPFHNVNCPKGFLFFNRLGELRISVLPTHLSYDATWPIRKVPLRCTPHMITYHPESKTYTVVSSTQDPCSKMMRVKEEERELVQEVRDDRFVWPLVEKFSFQLFSPVSWEAIPNTKVEMEDFENITALKSVYLRSEETHSGLKCYVAVGTNMCYGEEITSRGRIMLFSIIEVVPEPGQPLTKNKIKMIYDKEQKGPVTALAHVEGYLVGAIGQKIYIWALKDNDLSGVAFIDTQIYIHTITSIKNLMLIGDIHKSVSLLRFQTDFRVLSNVARDPKVMEVYACDYLVDNTQLGFLVTDKEQNLNLYMYQPEARESVGGTRLVRRGDMNIGTNINSMFRLRCKLSDPSTEKRASTIIEKKHTTFMGTLDGGINFILPITEKVYRRFLMLQNVMSTHIQHLAGLNPKAHRLYKTKCKNLTNPQRNIIDGDLVFSFMSLNENEKGDLARKVGLTSPNQIIEDLMEIDRITSHF